MKEKKHFIFFFLTTLLLVDLFLKSIPIELFLITIVLIQFFFLDKYSNAFVLLTIGPILYGAFFNMKNIDMLGGLGLPLGFLLILPLISKLKFQILPSFISLTLLLISFFFSAFLHQKGDHYADKFFEIVIASARYFFAFVVLFYKRKEINFYTLSIFFALMGAFILRLSINCMELSGPEHLFQFGFMRDQSNHILYNNFNSSNKLSYIVYHIPGFLVLISLAFKIISNKKLNFLTHIIFVILLFFISFYSGGRQNLLGFIVIFVINILVISNLSKLKKISLISIIVITTIYALFHIESEAITSLVEGGLSNLGKSSGRVIHYYVALDYFNKNPWTGIGIGYHFYGGNGKYPHNLFLELLSETGLVGTFFVLILALVSYLNNRKHINNQKVFLMILIPFFIKAMVSGSLSTSISVVCFIIALPFLKENKSYV